MNLNTWTLVTINIVTFNEGPQTITIASIFLNNYIANAYPRMPTDVSSLTTALTAESSSDTFKIGGSSGSNSGFAGYIANFKIVYGGSIYAAAGKFIFEK